MGQRSGKTAIAMTNFQYQRTRTAKGVGHLEGKGKIARSQQHAFRF